MYIYNTTFNIEANIVEQCLKEIETECIPKLLDSGLFEKALLTEVLGQPQPTGKTYSLQLFCPTETHLKQFQKFHSHIIENLVQPYQGKVVYFQTKMRVIIG